VKGKNPFEDKLFNDSGEELVITRTAEEFIVDRRKAGEAGAAHEIVGDVYGVSREKILLPEDGGMEIVFDVSILEVYADGGVFTATNLAFPTKAYTHVSVMGAEAEIAHLKM
jgi:fructan beta-fructosidase